jgi:hypothetical protein
MFVNSLTATATKAQTLATIDATVLAAQDVRVLDIIESHLQWMIDKNIEAFHLKMIDDLVLAIQAYLKDQSLKIQGELRTTAAQAKLEGVFVVVQIIKNSPKFQELVAEYTPDELPTPTPTQSVVAVGTTASVVATPKSSKATKAQKPAKAPKLPSPASSTENVATKSKVSKARLEMPSVATIADIEGMSRKDLMEAVKAVKSNNPDILIRANAATVELQKALASNLLGVDYVAPSKPAKAPKAPKTPKAAKVKEIIDLPEGFCWEDCKSMKYRQLQQICKALRSQGLFQGNIGGKGATTENLLKGCADYFRSQGLDIVEVELKSQKPAKDLHLPNFAAITEQYRLEKATTAALKLSNEDAKVALELAVAA